jgi:hypothetical protein
VRQGATWKAASHLSSLSDVQPVRCPVTWGRRLGVWRSGCPLSTRPASRGRPPIWRPLVQRPALCCPPRPSGRVRLVPPQAVALGTKPVRRATVTTERVEVAVGCRAVRRLGRRPSRPGAGDAAELARWSVGPVADPGPGRCGRRRVPAARPGRPGRLAERPSLVAALWNGSSCSVRLSHLPRGRRPVLGGRPQ